MTYQVKDGYSRLKNPPVISVRDLTKKECLSLSNHAEFIGNDGTLRTIKINGKVRTWKKSPDRIEVPVKYGMYEYSIFEWNGNELVTNSGARMVKRIETET